MKYLLDFDRVIFDWDAYNAAVDAEGLRDLYVDPAIWDTFAPADFYYDDVLSFVTALPKEDVIIITAKSPHMGARAGVYQERKLADSGIDKYASEIIIMEGDKAPYVCPFANQQTIFIDDKLTHLESVKNSCPAVHCLQMLRPAASLEPKNIRSEHVDIPVVQNFTEVDAILESWNLG